MASTVGPMRVPLVRCLGVALSLCALAACTSGSEDTIERPASSDGVVTGGQIIVSGDLSAGAPNSSDATVAPPGPATSSPAAPTTPATRSSTTASTVPRPATTTTTTTEAEVVGDGPVLTAPGRDSTAATPGVGGGLVPAFFAIEATATVACTTANPGTAQLRWEVIGTEAVDVALGSATNIFRNAQPPAGTLDVPLDCAIGSTYFVVATNAEGSTTRSVKLAADAAA